MYQPKTGKRCTCKRGVQRDNCPTCEGTGWVIDFRAIRDQSAISRAIKAGWKLNPEIDKWQHPNSTASYCNNARWGRYACEDHKI